MYVTSRACVRVCVCVEHTETFKADAKCRSLKLDEALVAELKTCDQDDLDEKLFYAVWKHDLEDARRLLDAGANPGTDEGRLGIDEQEEIIGTYATVLIAASARGDHVLVRMLLDRGADVKVTNDDGEDAIAIVVKSAKLASSFVHEGVIPDWCDYDRALQLLERAMDSEGPGYASSRTCTLTHMPSLA